MLPFVSSKKEYFEMKSLMKISEVECLNVESNALGPGILQTWNSF